jgi:hypothetical protein
MHQLTLAASVRGVWLATFSINKYPRQGKKLDYLRALRSQARVLSNLRKVEIPFIESPNHRPVYSGENCFSFFMT